MWNWKVGDFELAWWSAWRPTKKKLFLSDMLLHMVAEKVAGMVADMGACMHACCCTWWSTRWLAWWPTWHLPFLHILQESIFHCL